MSPVRLSVKSQTSIRRCAFKVPLNPKYQCQKPGELLQLHLNIWYCRFHDRHAKDRCQVFAEWEGSGAYAQCVGLAKFLDEKSGKKLCDRHFVRHEEKVKREKREEERQERVKKESLAGGLDGEMESGDFGVAKDEQRDGMEVQRVDSVDPVEDQAAQVEEVEITKEGDAKEAKNMDTDKAEEEQDENDEVEGDEQGEALMVETSEEQVDEKAKKQEQKQKQGHRQEAIDEKSVQPSEAMETEDATREEVESIDIKERANIEVEETNDTQEKEDATAKVATSESTKLDDSVNERIKPMAGLQELEPEPEPCNLSETSTIPTSSTPSTPTTESAPASKLALRTYMLFEKSAAWEKLKSPAENQTPLPPRRSVFASRNLSFLMQAANEQSSLGGNKRMAAMYDQCNVCLEKHSVEYMLQVEPCKHRYLNTCLKTTLRKGTFRRYNCTGCEAWMGKVKKGEIDV